MIGLQMDYKVQIMFLKSSLYTSFIKEKLAWGINTYSILFLANKIYKIFFGLSLSSQQSTQSCVSYSADASHVIIIISYYFCIFYLVLIILYKYNDLLDYIVLKYIKIFFVREKIVVDAVVL